MSRTIDLLSVVLLASGGVAFVLGIRALNRLQELHALYWLLVGALLLKASVDMLRPSRGG